MVNKEILKPTIIVIFGGSGDLNERKLTPAFYNLFLDKQMPEKFAIIGLGRTSFTDDKFRSMLAEGVNKFSRRGKIDKEAWEVFSPNISYLQSDVFEQKDYQNLAKEIKKIEKNWGEHANVLFLLCFVAMEPPVSFSANEIRSRKVDVLKAIRKYDTKEMDNWRWQNVPFYVRSGKRMPEKMSVITIQFRPVPHRIFPTGVAESLQPNRIIISINPATGIRIRFQAKQVGLNMRLGPEDMVFNYSDAYDTQQPEAYETLLHDVMSGDATLFMRLKK